MDKLKEVWAKMYGGTEDDDDRLDEKDKGFKSVGDKWVDMTPEQDAALEKDKVKMAKEFDKMIKDYLKKNNMPDRVGFVLAGEIKFKSKWIPNR